MMGSYQQSVGQSVPGRQTVMVFAMGILLVAMSFLVNEQTVRLGFLSGGATFTLISGLIWIYFRRVAAEQKKGRDAIKQFIAHDATPSFVTHGDGRIRSANRAAQRQFDLEDCGSLSEALKTSFANPAAILFRVGSRAAAAGSAQEDLFTRSGHIRISVHSVSADNFVWRVEKVAERAERRAMHESLQLPMVMAGRGDAILYMNGAARALVGTRAKSLEGMFKSLPLEPGKVATLLTTEGEEDVLIAEVSAGVGRRALYLLPAQQTLGFEEAPAPELGWHAFQELPVSCLKVTRDGCVQSYNHIATELIGEALKEGVALSKLMEGLGRPIGDWIQDALAGKAAQKSEFLRLKRSDKEVFVQVVLNTVLEDGEPVLIAVLHDATELKTLEAQFVQSQKMQAIGQLAGGVAHDFNNLLTAISGHCDLLLLRHDQGDPNYGDLMQINQNANRAAAMVGQLLAFSRKQTLRFETIDMRDTLADLTHLLNRLVGEKITLTLSHDPLLKPVRADKRQLEQVIMNLVVNARDAMPTGGEIRIFTEVVKLAEAIRRDRAVVPAGEYVTVKVEDSGCGIAPEERQKVFEPFFTTKRVGEGTGLGLSTAYGIVKQSNGFIFVESIVGEGTTFTVFLPIYEPAPISVPVAPEPVKAEVSSAGDGVVLLVEDEAPVRAFASRALRLRGFTVLEADSAEAALRTLEDQSLNIDVFVTDVVMPGMDGPSWVREALKQRPDVRVVFVSGYAEDNFGEQQKHIPNSTFLPKPFSLADLTETVQRQLH